VKALIVVLVLALAGATPAVSAPAPLESDTKLPAWLAPGAQLAVEGTADPGASVALLDGYEAIASAAVADDGSFMLRVELETPGRHRLALSSGEQVVQLGAVLVRPVRIAAVGDVTFGGQVGEAMGARGAAHPWQATGRVLRSADITTANLETAVSTRGRPVPDKEFHFRGRPAALAAARRVAGLDVVSVANNHTLDFGRVAFLDTIRFARRHGISTVGGGADLVSSRRMVVFARGGVRIAFLGYSDVRPEGFTAARTAGTAPAESASIQADVQAARRRAEIVVVWFHWGEELARTAGGRQRAFASAALNAGAQLVLGAHSHVLQPVVLPARRLLVAWSLGNFVFSPNSPGTDRTGILLVDLGADGVRGHRLRPARIVGVQPHLIR
jgi:poly-gamma-glutamate capsule biosynthesis protein CapA/YwtB (metallophosphatase superfamily)